MQRRDSDHGAQVAKAVFADGDRDLLPAWIILWAASVARVVAGLAEREQFGAEASLALLSVVAVPWVVLGPWLRRWLSEDSNGSDAS